MLECVYIFLQECDLCSQVADGSLVSEFPFDGVFEYLMYFGLA